MPYPVKRSGKRRILSTALLMLLMVIYIGIAPASRSSASSTKSPASVCDCYNPDQQRDGVRRRYISGYDADGFPIYSYYCDPVC